MASTIGLQATFVALGARQRRSHVRLSPAPAHVLRPTSHIFRGRVCSSSVACCSPPEGPSHGGKARTGSSRKAAAGLQALAVAAACAVGASVCLSRAAAISNVFPLRKLDPIATETTASASSGEERKTSRAGKTKLMLDEIMMFGRKGQGRECEDPCKKLVDHAFSILPRDAQLQLLEQISKGEITGLNIGEHEKYEMQIAVVQICLAMHKYRDAKEVLPSQKDIIQNDARFWLLEAVVHMMLAMEKMSTKTTTTTKEEDKEIKDLLDRAQKSWENFQKSKDLQYEPKTDDDN